MRAINVNSETASIWETCYAKLKNKIPFATLSWHISYLNTFTTHEKPLYIYDESLKVIAPMVVDADTVKFSGGQEISDYMDFIGEEINFPVMWERLILELKNQGYKKLELNNLRETSESYANFSKMMIENPHNILITREDTTPYLRLPTSFTEFTQILPHKQRHELARKLRKFEREYPEAKFIVSNNLNQDLEELIKLMQMQEQKKLFLNADNSSFFRALPANFPENLRLYKIEYNKQIAAIVLGFEYDSSFYLYNTGYDFINFPGAGFYLHAKTIEHQIEAGTQFYNFLQGNERYKYELGGRDMLVYKIQITLI